MILFPCKKWCHQNNSQQTKKRNKSFLTLQHEAHDDNYFSFIKHRCLTANILRFKSFHTLAYQPKMENRLIDVGFSTLNDVRQTAWRRPQQPNKRTWCGFDIPQQLGRDEGGNAAVMQLLTHAAHSYSTPSRGSINYTSLNFLSWNTLKGERRLHVQRKCLMWVVSFVLLWYIIFFFLMQKKRHTIWLFFSATILSLSIQMERCFPWGQLLNERSRSLRRNAKQRWGGW